MEQEAEKFENDGPLKLSEVLRSLHMDTFQKEITKIRIYVSFYVYQN